MNKHCRVLIVDPVHAQALAIEKMLNTMGHYCIATTKSVEEGLLLNRYGMRRFDVLIVPLPVLFHEGCQVNVLKAFNIENIVLYSCSALDQTVPVSVSGAACLVGGLPEYQCLERFMGRLAPPLSVREIDHVG